jgi:hypothetical protein
MSADEVAKAFVTHFYQTIDTNLDSLAGLYVSLQLLLVEMISSGGSAVHFSLVLYRLVLSVPILRIIPRGFEFGHVCGGSGSGGPSSSRWFPRR